MTTNNLKLQLTWPDYVIFAAILLICSGIGVYYGFIEKKKNVKQKKDQESEAQEYFVGSRNMSVLPISLSLTSSWISGISFMGTATEMYVYGTSQMFIYAPLAVTGLVISYVFLPVFHNLHVTSIYEYLEMRYDKKVRLFGSFLFTLSGIVTLPIIIYVPGLALNQVTGINVHYISPIICIICVFYTSLGGIKAVVWTDVIQAISMLGSILVIVILGTIKLGGFQKIWNINVDGDRIDYPVLTINPTVRHSILATSLGAFINWLPSAALNQNMMQRYVSLPTLRKARQAMWLFMFLLTTLITICAYGGLLLYAKYYDCDPLSTKAISAKDQLLPLFIIDILGGIPGLPGLFFAGLFSAALSSLSTYLNSIAAVCLEDFYKSFYNSELSEQHIRYFIRGIVVIFGLISVALVFVVEHLGTILQLSISLLGATAGPIIGLFVMGVLMPWVEKKGAFYGGIVGILSTGWLCTKAQLDIANGIFTFTKKSTSIDGCIDALNRNISVTSIGSMDMDIESSVKFHHLSYLLYGSFGMIVTIIVSLLISLGFVRRKCGENKVNNSLLAPFLRKYFKDNIIEANFNGTECVTHNFDNSISNKL